MIDRPPFEHVGHRGAVRRIVDEMMVGLVDEDRHVLRDAVEQLLHFLGRHHDAGGVVRVAEVYEAKLAGVLVGGFDHHADVLAVVLGERQLDRLGLDVRRVLVHRRIRRVDAEHLLAALQERRPDDLQHFARPGGEQDVLGLDAMMVGDGLHDVAIRVAVPVRVLPRVGHRLHDRLGRSPVVLVARELREGVVLRVAALELCRAALREQPRRRPKPYGTHGRGDSCKESTARKVMPDVH